MAAAAIRIGIGGWTYPPWRGAFYPPGLPQARELAYAASQLTAIEIEGTYYRRQTPATFARWRAAAPPGFVFSVKASRYCTNRADLRTAGEGIAGFLDQGIVELGETLGPLLWQFMATKRFDRDELAGFLALLPTSHAGVALRHVIEPRHESFADPAFLALAARAGVGVVLAASARFPKFELPDPPFVYARLQDARADLEQGYTEAELDGWAARAREWSEPRGTAPGRDVFVFFINGAKERAPAAARALIARLGRGEEP